MPRICEPGKRRNGEKNLFQFSCDSHRITVSPYHHVAEKGFTLIEVIVAIAILSISLVIVMQLFSGGLRASRTSCDYTRAIVHAKDKIEELSFNPVQVETTLFQDSGEFEDGFKWESEIQPYEDVNKELEASGFKLLKLKVKILWSNTAHQQKSVELVSLKVVSGENEK